MNEKELKKLSRTELRELYLEQCKRNEILETKLAEARVQLANKKIKIANSGTLAEASLALTNIFDEAQKAADLYLANVKGEAGFPEEAEEGFEIEEADDDESFDEFDMDDFDFDEDFDELVGFLGEDEPEGITEIEVPQTFDEGIEMELPKSFDEALVLEIPEESMELEMPAEESEAEPDAVFEPEMGYEPEPEVKSDPEDVFLEESTEDDIEIEMFEDEDIAPLKDIEPMQEEALTEENAYSEEPEPQVTAEPMEIPELEEFLAKAVKEAKADEVVAPEEVEPAKTTPKRGIAVKRSDQEKKPPQIVLIKRKQWNK